MQQLRPLLNPYLLALIAIATCAGVLYFSQIHFDTTLDTKLANDVAPGVSLKIAIERYREYLHSYGAVAAQRALLKALPNSSRAHVIQHEAGRFLFAAEGSKGIIQCASNFGGGCYHGFIEAALEQYGFGNVSALAKACEGRLENQQIVQCAHGVGHAVLIDAGYRDLSKALDNCEKIFAGDQKRTINCYDGIFMENNFGVFSRPPEDRWYEASNPRFPCDEPAVLKHPGAHEVCWGMQAQLTLSDSYPQFNHSIPAVEQYCEKIKNEDEQYVCFEAIARQIQVGHAGDIKGIVADCQQLTVARQPLCIAQAYETAYIYGNHSPEVLSICTTFAEEHKRQCYVSLYAGIATAFSGLDNRLSICSSLPEERYAADCARWMKSPTASVF